MPTIRVKLKKKMEPIRLMREDDLIKEKPVYLLPIRNLSSEEVDELRERENVGEVTVWNGMVHVLDKDGRLLFPYPRCYYHSGREPGEYQDWRDVTVAVEISVDAQHRRKQWVSFMDIHRAKEAEKKSRVVRTFVRVKLKGMRLRVKKDVVSVKLPRRKK